MKRKRIFSGICILLLLPAVAAHASGRAASDDWLRAELRLRDLGYYTGSIDGTRCNAALAALTAFCEQNGIPAANEPPEALYALSAVPAPYPAPDAAASAEGATAVTGEPLPWATVRRSLVVGRSYAVTACHGGMEFELRYNGGANHAHMTPKGDSDAKALAVVFGALHDYSKQPVVIRVDAHTVAGSLMACRHNDDAGDADTEYSLYFVGSLSDIGGLPDVDHESALRVAIGETAN